MESLKKSIARFAVASALLAASAVAGHASAGSARQDDAGGGRAGQWKEFAPSGGGFKVLLPQEPKRDKTDEAVYMGRWQASDGAGGGAARFRVMYVESGPSCGRGDVAAGLLQLLRVKTLDELKGRVLRDAAVSFGGRPGRLLEIAPEAAGHARVLLVAGGRRAYRLDATTPGDTEAERVTSARFFNSLTIAPEPAQAAADGEVDRLLADASFQAADGLRMDGKVIKRPAPHYPDAAKRARASGTVIVKVVVDEEGRVLAAQPLMGHPLLRGAAVEAARQARFEPTLVDGKPAKAVGCITYNFFLQ